MQDLEEMLYEPKTPVVTPTSKSATKDLNEILLGDDEIGDDE